MRKAALLCLTLIATPGLAAAAKPPVVIELYTAQGCASCGEANSYVGKLAEKPGVLALTFPVDYWDYLGWPDTFAKPEFADRQRAYVTRLDLREPYTPQVVIDGHAQAGGLQTEKVDTLLATAAQAPRRAPDMAFIGLRRVDVGSGPAPRGGAEVWLVRYDPREQDVVVRKGDNRGQTVAHRNVVREIRRLGRWRGRPTAYRLPPPTEDGLVTAVLVQGPEGGRILAAAQRTP
ncbi:MAG: DUF1223 domain-containing protein [Phenylobacterium sp.]|uniref:DUF1223 domain-containing protein n=1 Tax=Phenylobacterium sp. TaxID=1871053 RepID=UPI0027370BDA|nr:DUF1223 domain-containing protein [Phenylobacterium sp.]MDP3750116.1 DUF1223 domain-containing protein [Phenylobacterium sp.]